MTLHDVFVNVNPLLRALPAFPHTPPPPATNALPRGDLPPHRIDVLALLQEHRAAIGQHLQELGELRPLVAGGGIDVEELANLGKRETEPLAAEDELDPRPLALAIHAGLAAPNGRQQSLVLVE